MKKSVIAALSLFLLTFNIYSLEVAKNELEESSKNTVIEFINYAGPHRIIESAASIRGIGENLGIKVAEDAANSFSSSSSEKYYVIHAIDENEKSKLDADIIVLNKNAGVDHINNLRRIIAGYLHSAYAYSNEDSDTLAVFITVYNAVYRGKIDYFGERYKSVVTKNLDSKSCGLSINYKEWAGSTQIVIPLYDVLNGGLSTIDTTTISDSEVIKSMKDDEDRNIDARKDLVDIKERESDEAYDKAQKAQKDAVIEAKELAEEEAKTKELEEEAKSAAEKADDAQQLADENPDDEELQEMAEDARKEAELKQEEAAEQKQKEEEKRQQVEDSKYEAAKQQQLSDKKDLEAQNERKEIAKDQSAVQKENAAKAKIKSGYAMVLADETNLLSSLVRFNEDNGQIIKASPVKVIRNRTIFKTTDKYIAIAGDTPSDNNSNKDIKLVLLDLDKLEIFSESEQSVSENSVLVQSGSSYLCVISNDADKSWSIGQFDENLNLISKSELKVSPNTPITITDSAIVVTDSTGKLKLLDKNNLSNLASN